MAHFVILADNPVPPGGVVHALRTDDGVNIRAAHWPASGEARGTVVLFNGHTEFIEKYFEVIGELLGRRFAVATLDWRGQGLSERQCDDPQKSHVKDFADYGHDVAALMGQVVMPNCPPPYYILAHSLGGHLGLRALQDYPETFERAVLCAPMTGLPASGLMEGILRSMAQAARLFNRTDSYFFLRSRRTALEVTFPKNEVTRDQHRYERTQHVLKAEPRLLMGGMTWGWLDAALRSIDFIFEPQFMASIRVPILLFSAGNEKLVSNRSHVELASIWPNVSRVLIEDAWHEILMERDPIRARFWQEFDRFMGI